MGRFTGDIRYPMKIDGANIEFLTVDEILELHNDILDETGGEYGILNIGNIEFVVDFLESQMFSIEFHDIFHLAAYLLHGIVSGHPFVDGNKRTGLEAAEVFLRKNGYYLDIALKKESVIEFTLSIAVGDMRIETIREWLYENSRKTKYLLKDGIYDYGVEMEDTERPVKKEKKYDISDETKAIIQECIRRNKDLLKELAKY
jgi:death-on-curing protein